MRRALASFAALALVAGLAIGLGKGGASGTRHQVPEPVAVTAYAIPYLRVGEPSLSRFEKFEYVGGVELSGKHPNFGGISAFRMGSDGSSFLAITDTGDWIRGRVTYQNGKPSGLSGVTIAPVLLADGRRAKDAGLWDSESIAKDGDQVFIGIERIHTVLAFDMSKDGLRAGGKNVPVPSFVLPWSSNRGIEALGIMPSGGPHAGKLIGLSERSSDTDPATEGFVMNRDGSQPFRFSITRADGFDTTDLDFLPNGDLIVLERYFSPRRGVAMRLKRIRTADIRPDVVLQGDILLTLDRNHQIDNMEGLSIGRNAQGETIFTLVSDDNFSIAQRTLLLQFKWLGD